MTCADGGTLEKTPRSCILYILLLQKKFKPTYIHEPERLEIGMNLQLSSNVAALFLSPRVCSLGTLAKGIKAAPSEANMNYARKWHEAGSKRVEKQARK